MRPLLTVFGVVIAACVAVGGVLR